MNIRPLSKELQQKAIAELNEDPNRIEEDIKQIREWLAKQHHLNVRTEDQWLLTFLRGSKFSLQRTKEKLDFFYTIRTLAPELFSNRDPLSPDIQDVLKKGFIVPLPQLPDSAGPQIILLRWKQIQPDINSTETISKVALMITELMLNESDNFTVAGCIRVDDVEGFNFNYILQQTPAFAKKIVLAYQNGYPLRMKQFNFFNLPTFFEKFLNLFKPFLSEKLKNRLVCYGKNDFDDIYKTVPLSVLPKQYGGNGGCIDEIAADFKKKVESYRDWFLEDAKYCSDETKRPGKPKTSADVFGVEGSFRKLAVD